MSEGQQDRTRALVPGGVGAGRSHAGRRAAMLRNIKAFAPLVLALGCDNPRGEASAPPPMPRAAVRSAPPDVPRVAEPISEEPAPIGQFHMTFYYVATEDEAFAKIARKRAARVGTAATLAKAAVGKTEHAAIAPTPETVTIFQKSGCTPIAQVTPEFESLLALQGTGKLRDGRILDIAGTCPCERSPCFKITTTSQWGTSGTGRPLNPFRTVAVDRHVVKLGSLLYVPQLEGRTMPGRPPWGGFVHDGCVVADDTGGGIKGKQLDLFVGRRAYYLGLSGIRSHHTWAQSLTVFDGSTICERKGRRVGRKAAAS